jgi:Alanine racemase, N-terminal domain
MTIRLSVDRTRWWAHVTSVAERTDGLVPVVKGNGYGFGRGELAEMAAGLSPILAVGTVHEIGALPDGVTPVVLTPTLTAPTSADPVLTVGNQAHVDALRGWGGRVVVKLESSMHRYGGGVDLVAAAQRAGLRTVGVSIHPPLAGTDMEHLDQILGWLPQVDPSLDVWVSHLSAARYEALPDSHRYKLRLGTRLWHGDREALRLEADVLDVRPVRAGTLAGYRQVPVPVDGYLVMVGAGSAGGVAPLAGDPPGGLSPFHFARRRLALVEPPHMHTTMAVVPDGDPCPAIGDWVDVQRPLTMTAVDEVRWT